MLLILKFITIIDVDNGKEVVILKSSITQSVFSEFVSSYQTYQTSYSKHDQPFVYVNTDGAVKLVTDVVDSESESDEIFALSIAEDGFVEFLAFQD
ncbi:MAG: hypothetical protein CME65_09570 [Halobacteriovoraceae bacterium]|nr:hypothetical protein [Halobacteriovoraceae bacterium]